MNSASSRLPKSPFRLLRSGGFMLSALIVVYVGIHFFESDRGFSQIKALERKNDIASAKLSEIKGSREELERRVTALRPGSLDLDMLEETARRELGYTASGEVVLPGR